MGPRCTVRTDEGLIVHGYRVPDDYQGPDTVHRGACVRAIVWDKDRSEMMEDEHGRPQLLDHADGKRLTRPREHDRDKDYALRMTVSAAVPPPLVPRLEPASPERLPPDHSRIRWTRG